MVKDEEKKPVCPRRSNSVIGLFTTQICSLNSITIINLTINSWTQNEKFHRFDYHINQCVWRHQNEIKKLYKNLLFVWLVQEEFQYKHNLWRLIKILTIIHIIWKTQISWVEVILLLPKSKGTRRVEQWGHFLQLASNKKKYYTYENFSEPTSKPRQSSLRPHIYF